MHTLTCRSAAHCDIAPSALSLKLRELAERAAEESVAKDSENQNLAAMKWLLQQIIVPPENREIRNLMRDELQIDPADCGSHAARYRCA